MNLHRTPIAEPAEGDTIDDALRCAENAYAELAGLRGVLAKAGGRALRHKRELKERDETITRLNERLEAQREMLAQLDVEVARLKAERKTGSEDHLARARLYAEGYAAGGGEPGLLDLAMHWGRELVGREADLRGLVEQAMREIGEPRARQRIREQLEAIGGRT